MPIRYLRRDLPADAGIAGTGAVKAVPRIGRILDLAGALLFLGGGGLFLRSWTGFREVRGYQPAPEDGPWAAVRLADEYWRLQRAGMGLMIAGVAVFVLAWWVARRAARGSVGAQAGRLSEEPR